MNTMDFIRHHTRLILEEEEKTTKYSTRKGLGAGKASAEAKQSLGLAASQPAELIKRLNMGNYQTRGSTKFERVFNFISDAITKSKMGIAFDRPKKSNNKIEIPIVMLGGTIPAVQKSQAPRYIEASLLAGGLTGLIDFDNKRERVQLAGTGKGEDETFAVIITYAG